MDHSTVGCNLFFGVKEVDAKRLHAPVVDIGNYREYEADALRPGVTQERLTVRPYFPFGRTVVRSASQHVTRVGKRLFGQFPVGGVEGCDVLGPQGRLEAKDVSFQCKRPVASQKRGS
jgi:hypothetical protein